MRQFTLELPTGLPVWNANSRGHHMQRADVVSQWRDSVGWLAREQKLPTGLDRVDVELLMIPADRRRRDPDNLAGVLKPCLDGLVDVGVLPDDSATHVASVTLRVSRPRPGLRDHRWFLSMWELPPDEETALYGKTTT
jgi:crossover junction endodeoxyribonuclease RusA